MADRMYGLDPKYRDGVDLEEATRALKEISAILDRVPQDGQETRDIQDVMEDPKIRRIVDRDEGD